MKVFLSWSGNKSKDLAEATKEWLECVLQPVRPWISTKGIESGSLWYNEISQQLNDSSVGLVFLTKDNLNSSWILFEAGALAKGLPSNRVCTVLVDLEPADIHGPLANFNHTLFNKDNMYTLVHMLNSMLGEAHLKELTLTKVFNKYWPDIEEHVKQIEESHPIETPQPETQKSPNEDILKEILLTTRGLSKRLNFVENNLGSSIENNKSNHDHLNKNMKNIEVRLAELNNEIAYAEKNLAANENNSDEPRQYLNKLLVEFSKLHKTYTNLIGP